MLSIKKKKKEQYLVLVPLDDETARWEIVDKAELGIRAAENQLAEETRVFKIDQEIKLRFEKITHLEV